MCAAAASPGAQGRCGLYPLQPSAAAVGAADAQLQSITRGELGAALRPLSGSPSSYLPDACASSAFRGHLLDGLLPQRDHNLFFDRVSAAFLLQLLRCAFSAYCDLRNGVAVFTLQARSGTR